MKTRRRSALSIHRPAGNASAANGKAYASTTQVVADAETFISAATDGSTNAAMLDSDARQGWPSRTSPPPPTGSGQRGPVRWWGRCRSLPRPADQARPPGERSNRIEDGHDPHIR
ncbi:hypothetical protein GCM10009541_29420 [Micromonospora gifhornensis]|uniref:Uncharacterized protein n=1 Tax=Micromonospora gifhornensis TaxID=84594 RepID=A0ABQ4I8G1_9ACTN|nr:hypothetical protein Vgi01_08590 [Micromonospora gifhornensis]